MNFREQLKSKIAKQREKWTVQIANAQSGCKHPDVLHWDGNGNISTMHPRRICVHCGLEEEGSWWSTETNWRAEEGATALPNQKGRSIAFTDSSHDFYSYRIHI